jgi:phosphoribosylglycinamide formyltransferase-1
MKPRPRIGILASGVGSNMEAIADACESGELPGEVALVISNVPDAAVLTKAVARQLPCCCINHRQYSNRDAFDEALLTALRGARVDLVVLAGFMRILGNRFIGEYYGSLLNIHPSLLPKYPGLDTHRRALDAGDREAGATVHFVIPELDAGPAIIQARVPIDPTDDVASLSVKVQEQEHRIYPQAVRWWLEDRVALRNGHIWRDGTNFDDGMGSGMVSGMSSQLDSAMNKEVTNNMDNGTDQ